MKPLRIKQLAFLSLLILACQDDTFIDDQTETMDEDMIAATILADDYLMATTGRNSDERSITVLQYRNGELYFNTNTDDIKGYQLLTETSVTAYVKPGEYIFWFSGGGVTDLDSIDFDATSEMYLDDLAEEINADKMWVVKMPEIYDPSFQMLKYDIVYESREEEGEYIRLDPKIQVHD